MKGWGMLFQKQTGVARVLQRARYLGWRATGLVDRRKEGEVSGPEVASGHPDEESP